MFEYESVNDMFRVRDEKEESKLNYRLEARAQSAGPDHRYSHLAAVRGYGSQSKPPHPFYRTSSSEYGWHAPGCHSVPSVYFPIQQRFSSQLAAAGMYRNYSLNTANKPSPYI